jgi:hypothetical protein
VSIFAASLASSMQDTVLWQSVNFQKHREALRRVRVRASKHDDARVSHDREEGAWKVQDNRGSLGVTLCSQAKVLFQYCISRAVPQVLNVSTSDIDIF